MLFYCHVLAVGSFSTLIHSATFRCTPFPLHFFASFISPTSAPHSKSGSFSPCCNPQPDGFPCLGICKTQRTFAFVYTKFTKAPSHFLQIAQATPSQPSHIAAVRSIATFAFCRPTLNLVCFIFFSEVLAPSTAPIPISISLIESKGSPSSQTILRKGINLDNGKSNKYSLPKLH